MSSLFRFSAAAATVRLSVSSSVRHQNRLKQTENHGTFNSSSAGQIAANFAGFRFLLRFPYAFMNSAHKFRVSQSTLSCLSLPKVKQLPWIYSESTLNLLWIYTERIHSGSAEKSARSDSERIVALNCRSVCRLSSFDLSSRLAITPRSECEVIGPIFDLCLFYKRFDMPNLGVRLLCIARFCRKLYGSAS